MKAAIRSLELADRFPPEERYGWRFQARKSAPSVCASIAEAWRKRRYKAHFISKLTDAESEAAEMQVWMELEWRRGYITNAEFDDIFDQYEKVLAQLVLFEESTKTWKTTFARVLFFALLGPILLALTTLL